MKPILFNTEMVKAILEGRKTVTRRIIKPQPKSPVVYGGGEWLESEPCANGIRVFVPPYKPGDILYVRETWRVKEVRYPPSYCEIEYKAGGSVKFDKVFALPSAKGEWKPSIHMPKEAARIFLRVKSVRVERLRDMVLADVLTEGIAEGESYEDTWKRWHDTWNSTVATADLPALGWKADPWVWVIKFERCEKEK